MKRAKAFRFTDQQKQATVTRALAGESVASLAKELKTHESVVYGWKRKAVNGSATKADGRMDVWVKGERSRLLQLVGEQALEIARLKEKR